MKGIHLGRYEGKTTQAIAEVRRLGAIGGNRVLLVTVSRKEGDKIFQAQKAKGEPILRPISIEQLLKRNPLRCSGITHVVIDGMDRWLHRYLAEHRILLAGLTINDEPAPAPAPAPLTMSQAFGPVDDDDKGT